MPAPRRRGRRTTGPETRPRARRTLRRSRPRDSAPPTSGTARRSRRTRARACASACTTSRRNSSTPVFSGGTHPTCSCRQRSRSNDSLMNVGSAPWWLRLEWTSSRATTWAAPYPGNSSRTSRKKTVSTSLYRTWEGALAERAEKFSSLCSRGCRDRGAQPVGQGFVQAAFVRPGFDKRDRVEATELGNARWCRTVDEERDGHGGTDASQAPDADAELPDKSVVGDLVVGKAQRVTDEQVVSDAGLAKAPRTISTLGARCVRPGVPVHDASSSCVRTTGESPPHRGACPWCLAGDLDGAAEGLDAVAETDESRPLSGVGSPDPVIADREQDDPFLSRDLDVHDRRFRVLGGVRQRLRDEVVGGHLDALRQPTSDAHLQLDRDRRPAGERLQRGIEATLGEDSRMDAARNLAELVKDLDQASPDPRQSRPQVLELGRCHRRCATHLEPERDEPLLGPVMQIPLDPSPGLVSRGDYPRPRGLHLAQPQPVRNVLERHHRAPAALEVDRRGRVRHHDARAVLANKPILFDANRLPGQEGPQERALLRGKRRPVRAKVVDRLVARLSEQLLLIRIAENADGGRVEKGDSPVRVNDVQRVRNSGGHEQRVASESRRSTGWAAA